MSDFANITSKKDELLAPHNRLDSAKCVREFSHLLLKLIRSRLDIVPPQSGENNIESTTKYISLSTNIGYLHFEVWQDDWLMSGQQQFWSGLYTTNVNLYETLLSDGSNLLTPAYEYSYNTSDLTGFSKEKMYDLGCEKDLNRR